MNSKKFIRRICAKIIKLIIKFEHEIYCLTNCKVDLFLHREYYKYRKFVYNRYLRTKRFKDINQVV